MLGTRLAVLLLAAALTLPLTACGGGSDSGSGTRTVRLEVDGNPVNITYQVEGGEVTPGGGGGTTWSKELDVPAGKEITLWVKSEGARQVSCRIEVDGDVEDEDDAEGVQPSVKCVARA